jgi:hypothetical protein
MGCSKLYLDFSFNGCRVAAVVTTAAAAVEAAEAEAEAEVATDKEVPENVELLKA